VDDEELAAELEHVRADLVSAPADPRLPALPVDHGPAYARRLAPDCAGRYDEAIASASEANRTRTAAVALTRQPPPGAVLWQACEAKAVAHPGPRAMVPGRRCHS